MTLQPSTANFSLINYSQEKDLNNLVAARKHQKNPEKDLPSLFFRLRPAVMEKQAAQTLFHVMFYYLTSFLTIWFLSPLYSVPVGILILLLSKI